MGWLLYNKLIVAKVDAYGTSASIFVDVSYKNDLLGIVSRLYEKRCVDLFIRNEKVQSRKQSNHMVSTILATLIDVLLVFFFDLL